MSTHKTAALVVTFYDYLLKTSPTGQYYVFKVTDKDGHQDICRSDEIHRSAIEPIFEAIDKGETIDAPVIRDVRHGYRIDLSAVHDFFPRPAKPPVFDPTASVPIPAPKHYSVLAEGKTSRIQTHVTPAQAEALRALAEAESYPSLSDWLRALLERILDAARRGGAA